MNKINYKLFFSIVFVSTLLVFFVVVINTTKAQVGDKKVTYNFTRNLSIRSVGNDVKLLQQFLNLNNFPISTSGAGSFGKETTYFGTATKLALVKWQKSNGILPANGLFDSKSRLVFKNITKNLPETNNTIIDEQVISVIPVHIKIPQINIDAIIIPVGLTVDGAMDSPVGPDEAGWFNVGPIPGEVGSAVIDGHSGWKNGIPAVFDNLYKLKIGDKIYIENKEGKVATFIVRESKKYDPTADATSVFISTDGKSHLNLITCTGTWDPIKKSRSNRLIVFTDKID